MLEALRSYLSRSRKSLWVVFTVSAGVTVWRLVDAIDNVQVLAGLRDNPIVRAIWQFLSDPRLHGVLVVAGLALGIFGLVRKFSAKRTGSSNVPALRAPREIEAYPRVPEIPIETKREPLAEDDEEIEVLIKYRRRRRVS
jgi:hypothetical protein